MKITANLYIKPLKFNQPYSNTQENRQTPIKNTNPQIAAYQDFNINFTGRTPEDFYAQDFNRENMPQTMKNYLYYDYEQRQHIPPEQMMHEVFKYIEDAKSLDEVKKLYPNEPLFANLHEATKKSRTGILSEIKTAKELSDAPLFKDGSDNFGVYLLKKIYSDGKTLKEISKDFLEKDINDEYKGVITQPINYETTSAYGIRFPKTDFWHSFIATREEYKKFFVTLPKNTVDPNRTAAANSSHSNHTKTSAPVDKSEETANKPRKFKIKKYQKDQLENDIKTSDMSTKDIERKIRRRFKKDDPEASFIVKYLSPIMIVSADRVHLSEELKAFNEIEKSNGKQGDETHMLKRFWKNNPILRTEFAQAITDTIELFEDNYGAGGMIPINNEFQQITAETPNQKIIDFVTPNFIDLVNQVKNLEIERELRYKNHDELQTQWEEHFKNRALETAPADEPVNNIEENKPSEINIQKAMDEAAAKNPGVKFYTFNLENGTKISLAINLKEILRDKISQEYKNMPKIFINKYINFILNHPKVDENFLLSFACNANDMMKWGNFISDKDNKYTEEELEAMNYNVVQEIKKQLIPEDEVFQTLNEIYAQFEEENPKFIRNLRQAIMEYSTTLNTPQDEYLKLLIDERYKQMLENGNIPENISNEDKLATYTKVYSQAIQGIHTMKTHNMVYLDTRSLEAGLAFLSIGNDTQNQAAKIDEIMQKYKAPLSNSELNAIRQVFMDTMLNMDTEKTETFKDPSISGFYKASMAALKDKKNSNFKKEFINILCRTTITKDNTILRYLIDKNADENLCEAIVEFETSKLMQEHMELFKMLASIDQDIMDTYIKYSNPDLYKQLSNYRIHSALEHFKNKHK